MPLGEVVFKFHHTLIILAMDAFCSVVCVKQNCHTVARAAIPQRTTIQVSQQTSDSSISNLEAERCILCLQLYVCSH
jgi:hypothetical protein